MVALGFDKHRPLGGFEPVDHGVGAGIGAALSLQQAEIIKRAFRLGESVDLLAGGFTAAAPDTAGHIVQHPEAFLKPGKLPVTGGLRSSGDHNLAAGGGTHPG